MTIIIYYCGQESLRRNGVAITVNKRVQNAVLGCSFKNDTVISVRFQCKPFSITVIQVYVEQFYEDLQDLLDLAPKKDVLFIIGGRNAKVGSQEIPAVTGKFVLGVQNKADQRLTVLSRDCTGHSKHPVPTTQDSTHGHHQMVNTEIRLIIFFVAEDGEALYSQQK